MANTQGVKSAKRGRFSKDEWQLRARYVLKYLGDPIALQRSPFCRLVVLERLAKAKYADSIVPKGRALHELAVQCLQEIEDELDGHRDVARLKEFAAMTRQGMRSVEASRALGITPEHASRALKRQLIELLAQKLILKLR